MQNIWEVALDTVNSQSTFAIVSFTFAEYKLVYPYWQTVWQYLSKILCTLPQQLYFVSNL